MTCSKFLILTSKTNFLCLRKKVKKILLGVFLNAVILLPKYQSAFICEHFYFSTFHNIFSILFFLSSESFYIARAHIVTFCFFILPKDKNIFFTRLFLKSLFVILVILSRQIFWHFCICEKNSTKKVNNKKIDLLEDLRL